jgi:hypothetical protein
MYIYFRKTFFIILLFINKIKINFIKKSKAMQSKDKAKAKARQDKTKQDNANISIK